MVSEKATLVNPQGLHMRPAGLFASTMGKFASDVTVVAPDKEVNGKSPMALMAAGIPCGTEVEVKCDGADEKEALAAAIELKMCIRDRSYVCCVSYSGYAYYTSPACGWVRPRPCFLVG